MIRYDAGEQAIENANRKDNIRPHGRGGPGVFSSAGEMGNESGSDDDEDIWEKKNPEVSKDIEEDFHRREEELQAELQFATMRCEELKRTLNETKSIIGSKQNLIGGDGIAGGGGKPAGADHRKAPAGAAHYDVIAENNVSDYEEDEFSDDDLEVIFFIAQTATIGNTMQNK